MFDPNLSPMPNALASPPASRGTAALTKKNKSQQPPTVATKKLSSEDGLLCVDFLPGFNMLALGYTKAVRLAEVIQTTHPSCGPIDEYSTPLRTPVSFALRLCGMFGNVAKVEALAWYPNSSEAVLAFVQLGRNITVLFDTLIEKDKKYMAQQWSHNAKCRRLSSTTSAVSESLSTAVVGTVSMPSTPFYTSSSSTTTTTTMTTTTTTVAAAATVKYVQRTVGSCSMVEAVINTEHLRVERIAWDPHNPYTLALTSNATHFELWSIPVIDNTVYPPRLRLRPPAHDERSITRAIAFSPSNPNLIVVAVEVANAGKVIIYDRRHVEVPRSVDMTGPCLTVAFHPTFCDLLGVCYRKAKTKTDSRVQFFRVLGEVGSGTQRESASNNNNNSNSSSSGGGNSTRLASRGALPIVGQEIIPPIDSVDSLNRLRWRPCESIETSVAVGTVGESSADTSDIKIDAISSQLWFATTALNGQEVGVWDAANGFTPIFSIKNVHNGWKPDQQERDQRERTLQEPTDCIWVNPLTLVSVFKGGDILLTSLLDESTTSKDTLFRCPVTTITNHNDNSNGNKGNSNYTVAKGESDVFSLGALLPAAAVVAGFFGRSFVIRNTTSFLREYYSRIISAEKQELLKHMGFVEGNPSPSNTLMMSPVRSRNYRDSIRATPIEGLMFDKRPSPLLRPTPLQTSPQSTPLHRSDLSPTFVTTTATPITTTTTTPTTTTTTTTIHAASASSGTRGGKRFEFLFPLLYSLGSPPTTTGIVPEEFARNERSASRHMERVGQKQQQLQEQSASHSAATSFVVATERCPRGPPRGGGGGLDVQSESNREDKSWALLVRHSEAAAVAKTVTVTTAGTRSMREGSEPVDSNLTERNDLLRLASPHSDSRAINSPISLTPSDDVHRQRAPFTITTGRKDRSISSSLYDSQLKNGVSAPTNDTVSKASLLLGYKSLVTPEIESFVLSDEVCGWAYVERSSEHETFARYATGWEVGYEVARHMRAARHASGTSPDEKVTAAQAHKIDDYFAKIMLHNAKVCKEREREVQRERSSNVNRSACGSKRGCHSGNEVGSVDPRGHLWSAAAQAVQSHNVTFVTSLIRSQLDYASLMGDIQYCAVLFLLFCLWWKQRYVCLYRYPCPLLSQNDVITNSCGSSSSCSNNHNPNNNTKNNHSEDSKGVERCSGTATECTPRQWRLRARQWLEQYVYRLFVRKLHVPLNELLLIVPDVMGESNLGLPRANDIAQKLFTCIYCGTCQKAELVPRLPKDSRPMISHALSSTLLGKQEDEEEEDHDLQRSTGDDSGASFGGDSFSSACSVLSCDCKPLGVETPVDNVAINKEEKEKGVVSVPPRNARCSRCHSGFLMTCVICEEVVEGMYLWLRSCGHGGHVHHIKEWLQVSNECPRCGVPILFSDDVSLEA